MTYSDSGHMADRARLARELHDGIAQDLVGIGYSLDLLLANPETSRDTRTQLRTLRFTVTDLIDKVRKEIYFLRQPPTSAFAHAIKMTAEELCPGLELKLDLDGVDFELDAEVTYEIHRIAQEVLRNIASHAQAKIVTITLHRDKGTLDLYFADDGVGGAIASDSRYGIQSIRDRALAINGSVEIQSNSEGTRVRLRVPNEEHANG